MNIYINLLKDILINGEPRIDRTGTGTVAVFGRQITIDLTKGFPLLTTKKIHFKSVVAELLWFLKGDTNTNWLHQRGVTIWDEWADKNGNLGPIYGAQMRSWKASDGTTIDQISSVINSIKNNPYSRRHIVSMWNPADLPDEAISPVENVAKGKMALAPCHMMFQFFVSHGKLSCHMYQRSVDAFLGLPYNIASYALLTHLIARETGLGVGNLIMSFGDLHIYNDHLTSDIVFEQLKREPRELPTLIIKTNKSIFDYVVFDIDVADYDPHPKISAPISV